MLARHQPGCDEGEVLDELGRDESVRDFPDQMSEWGGQAAGAYSILTWPPHKEGQSAPSLDPGLG